MSIPPAGLFHLIVLYLVWGSTYLGNRAAIGPGGGFQPFWVGLLRFFPAALLLLGFAWVRKMRVRPTSREWVVLGVSGILLWVFSTGFILIATRHATSSYAALMISATPIWTTIIEAILKRQAPSQIAVFSLIIGFLGIVTLSVPSFSSRSGTDLSSFVLLSLSPVFWSIGSIYTQRSKLSLEPIVVSGYQQLFGGLGYIVMILVFNERWTTPTLQGWIAYSYLLIFASLIAYTSFIICLRLLPVGLITTYAYVNPVVAVILGRLILNEAITWWTVGGAILVLLGVAGVFRSRAA